MILNSVTVQDGAPRLAWPFYLPTITHLMRHGITFEKPITFIVGENGSGKSTLIEALAEAYGLDVRGGHGDRKYAISSYSEGPLAQYLDLEYPSSVDKLLSKKAPGFFLRSETAKDVLEYMSAYNVPGYGDNIAQKSHGEGYLQVLNGRFTKKGLYLLDEPEAALSFNSSLLLMKQLKSVVANGSQVICATHSPIITALPEADVLEFSDQGIHKKSWEELELVNNWQRYMANPTKHINALFDLNS